MQDGWKLELSPKASPLKCFKVHLHDRSLQPRFLHFSPMTHK